MIATGNIITQGTQVFTPIFTRLRELAQEFIPYFIFITISALGVALLRLAVQYIMRYLSGKSKGTFRDYRRGPEQEDSWSGMRKYYKEYQDHGYKLDDRIKKKYNL